MTAPPVPAPMTAPPVPAPLPAMPEPDMNHFGSAGIRRLAHDGRALKGTYPNSGELNWLGWCGPAPLDHSKFPFYTCDLEKSAFGESLFRCSPQRENRCNMDWAKGFENPYVTCGSGTKPEIIDGKAYCVYKDGSNIKLEVTCPLEHIAFGATRSPVPQKWEEKGFFGWEGFVCPTSLGPSNGPDQGPIR